MPQGLANISGSIDVQMIAITVKQKTIFGHEACLATAEKICQIDVGESGYFEPRGNGSQIDPGKRYVGVGNYADMSHPHPVTVGTEFRIDMECRHVIEKDDLLASCQEVANSLLQAAFEIGGIGLVQLRHPMRSEHHGTNLVVVGNSINKSLECRGGNQRQPATGCVNERMCRKRFRQTYEQMLGMAVAKQEDGPMQWARR